MSGIPRGRQSGKIVRGPARRQRAHTRQRRRRAVGPGGAPPDQARRRACPPPHRRETHRFYRAHGRGWPTEQRRGRTQAAITDTLTRHKFGRCNSASKAGQKVGLARTRNEPQVNGASVSDVPSREAAIGAMDTRRHEHVSVQPQHSAKSASASHCDATAAHAIGSRNCAVGPSITLSSILPPNNVPQVDTCRR